jgi:predicted  nucleic acid-binding Zn-ribbon protein
MKCLKCGHTIPDKADKCLYCGARNSKETSSEIRTDPSESLASSAEGGKNAAPKEAAKKEINYRKLEELPLSLRAKVEEMLKKGDGKKEEITTTFHNFPESMERTGRKRMGFMSALRILLKKD